MDIFNQELKKCAVFTDLHVGAKSNAQQHNEDCVDYIQWFCNNVKNDQTIDHVIFAGDWHETRSAINIFTLKYSYEIAKQLNELGMPIFFIVGNHDLYHRNTRDVYSLIHFNEFNNFMIIDEPTVFDNIGNGVLMCPFLFHEEYPILSEYNKIPFWIGHFEFKGFVVTGYNITMKSGPDHTNFKAPKHIISGHFHRRQQSGNVTYLGNAFPTNFSDAGDFARGMMVYDHNSDDMVFMDWEACPKYITGKLSDIINGNVELFPEARVKTIADVPITYEENLEIKKQFMESHNLREFNIIESSEISEALSETTASVDIADELSGVNEMVVHMLGDIDSDHINNELLQQIFQDL